MGRSGRSTSSNVGHTGPGINSGPESVSHRTRDESEAVKAISERGVFSNMVRSYIVRSEHKGGNCLYLVGPCIMYYVSAGSLEEILSTVVYCSLYLGVRLKGRLPRLGTEGAWYEQHAGSGMLRDWDSHALPLESTVNLKGSRTIIGEAGGGQ